MNGNGLRCDDPTELLSDQKIVRLTRALVSLQGKTGEVDLVLAQKTYQIDQARNNPDGVRTPTEPEEVNPIPLPVVPAEEAIGSENIAIETAPGHHLEDRA